MNGRPDSDREPPETPAESTPTSLADISLGDRWAPLVRDPSHKNEPSLKLGLRTLASFICLIVLGLILWAL